MDNSFTERSLFAFFWSAINKGSKQVVNLVVFIILARILSIDDFGLMALAAVYISILNILIEQGFSIVIIQRENLSTSTINTIFTLSVITSLILLILGLSYSSKISMLFERPELENLLFYSNFILLVGPIYNISSALVRKNLDFKTFAISALISSFIGGSVSIILALYGYGVWSLLVKFYIETFLLTVFLYYNVRWKPKLQFSIPSFKDIYKSSSYIFGINALKLLSKRILDFSIGYFIGVSQLGLFDVASRLYNSLNSILNQIMSSVSLPLFSEIQNSKKLSTKVYTTLFKYSLLIPVPMYLLFLIISEPLILICFGEKWNETIYIAQILFVAGILQQFQSINESFLFARDKMKIKLVQEVIKITMILLMFFILYPYGIRTIPWILLLSAIFSYTFDLILTNAIIETSIFALINQNYKTIIALTFSSCLTILLLLNLEYLNNVYKTLLSSVFFTAVFMTSLFLTNRELKENFISILSYINKK